MAGLGLAGELDQPVGAHRFAMVDMDGGGEIADVGERGRGGEYVRGW